MGMRPPRMCKRCHNTALPGTALCQKHTDAPDTRKRNDLRPLYKCKAWYVTRAHVLARDPICTWDGDAAPCPRLSTDCDHVIDAELWLKQGGDFYDMDNLRGLCHGHHSRRTAREQGFAQGTKACKLKAPQWKPVNLQPYNKAYEVSDTGQVRRIGKQTPIRSRPIKGGGYLQVELWPPAPRPTRYKQAPPKRQVKLYVHRLVALTFVPNPDGKRYVNHKDGHKQNNRADNLEWVTMDENNAHSVDRGLGRSMTSAPYRSGARSPVCKAAMRMRG